MVAVWQDTTREDESAELEEEQAELLKDQDLSNALASTDYVRALRLAFELRRPFRMLKVFEELLRGEGGADKVERTVAGLDKEHLQVSARKGVGLCKCDEASLESGWFLVQRIELETSGCLKSVEGALRFSTCPI